MHHEKSCGALVLRRDEESGKPYILMIRHKNGGHRSFPKGHMERGETEYMTAIREVFEETGLKISEPQLCGVKDWSDDKNTRSIVLLYKTDKFEGTLTPSDEGDVFWVELSEFNNLKLSRGMDRLINVFLKDDVSEEFFYKENGNWVEILK